MTTKLELSEILRISEETGRGIQERTKSDECGWRFYNGDVFSLSGCEYRLAPKIVRHERWLAVRFSEENTGYDSKDAAEKTASILGSEWKVASVAWETEE